MGRRLRRRRRLLQLPDPPQPEHEDRMKIGWQVQPRFAVVQGERSVGALYLIRDLLGCGRIYRNERHDNHREHMMSYVVHRQDDLRGKVVPFFEANPLRTAKLEEFRKFSWVLGMMAQRLHLTVEGLRRIATVVETMNHRKPSRFLESSEAIRQPALVDVRVEDMVPPSWRHEDRGAKFLVR
jgi:hypothetical protein